MIDKTCLLDDATMRQFIVNGYIQVQAELPASFHQRICRKIDDVLAQEGNPGDDLLPKVSEIQQVFDSPTVRGALTSLLGTNYVIHPHRHCHNLGPGESGQHWHKDDYVADQNVRHHRFRWVMAFYYPQDVSEDMGPTAIVPGRQFYNTVYDNNLARTAEELETERDSAVARSQLANHDSALVRRVERRLAVERAHTIEHGELPLCGKAGTVNLVNFDTWHRATANRSEKMRYMLKFQFTRMQEPEGAPSWNSTNPRWQSVSHDTHPRLSEDVWSWLHGRERSGTTPDAPASKSLQKLLAALRATDEAACLEAAYRLGGMGATVVPALVEALREEAPALCRKNLGRTRANPEGGNPGELYSAHALGVVGFPAVAALCEALSDGQWPVRAAAADTLGNMGATAKRAVPALLRAVADENVWVRRNAIEAVGTIGYLVEGVLSALLAALHDADHRVRRNAAIALSKIARRTTNEAVPALLETLTCDHRYVSFYAAIALGRIGTREARDALSEALSHDNSHLRFSVTTALKQIETVESQRKFN